MGSLVAQMIKNLPAMWEISLGWEDPLEERASLVAQTVKNPPAMWETCVRSLHGEDPLEEGMATHSSILAGELPWREVPGGRQSMGS